ncbi:MAG: hypothetical protein V2J51_00960 [Erythrobacter sp.]|jgi:hypothetical protein|nr:hypothetical protein [Erythrobacter sp.]
MSVAFALIFGAIMQQDAPRIAPRANWSLTDTIAEVRYDCLLTDLEGQRILLKLLKSGQQAYLGEYTDRHAASEFPLIRTPTYRVLEGSSPRLATTLRFVPGGRNVSPSIGDRGDIVFLDHEGVPAALFRFEERYAASEGVPLSAFLPKVTDPKSLETLAGVCSVERLEDESK